MYVAPRPSNITARVNSGHFLQKQMRQAGFFFSFLFPPKTNEATFFFYQVFSFFLNVFNLRGGHQMGFGIQVQRGG